MSCNLNFLFTPHTFLGGALTLEVYKKRNFLRVIIYCIETKIILVNGWYGLFLSEWFLIII